MTVVTTPRALVQLFAAHLGVQPGLPRKLLRQVKRENKQAQYRARERATTSVAIASEAVRNG